MTRVSPLCIFCPGEHQHSRQCVPGVGIFKGGPPLPPSQLHPASAGVHIRTATTSMDQPTGILQVSTFSPGFNISFVSGTGLQSATTPLAETKSYILVLLGIICLSPKTAAFVTACEATVTSCFPVYRLLKSF